MVYRAHALFLSRSSTFICLIGWNDSPKEGLSLDPDSLGCHPTTQHPKICIYQAEKLNQLSSFLNKVLP